MKRIIALIATLCLLLACVPAMAVSPAEVLGDWYLCYREDGDNLIPVPTANVKLTFNRDSTVDINFEGLESSSTWKLDSDGDVRIESVNDSQLLLTSTQNGLKGSLTDEVVSAYREYYYFDREPVEAEVFPEPIVASQEDDFFGEWVTDYNVIDSVRYEIEEPIQVKIEFAQVTVTRGEDDVRVTLTDYKDGKLIANAYDIGLARNYDADAKAIAELTTDGSLLLTVEGASDQIPPCYLKRADGSVVIPQPAEAVEDAAEAVEEAVEEAAEEVADAVEEAVEETKAD